MDLIFDLNRDTPFRFTCGRCCRCCHNQRIRLNPYEVLRLARNRGVSTGAIIAMGTVEAGTILQFSILPGERESTCVFLGDDGCAVHEDRPLACRLYPLGRRVSADGAQRYGLLPGHPACEGMFGMCDQLGPHDTIGSFVDAQGAQPYFRASDGYFAILRRLISLLAAADKGRAEDQAWTPWEEGDLTDWVDADAAVARYCAEKFLPNPQDIEATTSLHLQALRDWADAYERDQRP